MTSHSENSAQREKKVKDKSDTHKLLVGQWFVKDLRISEHSRVPHSHVSPWTEGVTVTSWLQCS